MITREREKLNNTVREWLKVIGVGIGVLLLGTRLDKPITDKRSIVFEVIIRVLVLLTLYLFFFY